MFCLRSKTAQSALTVLSYANLLALICKCTRQWALTTVNAMDLNADVHKRIHLLHHKIKCTYTLYEQGFQAHHSWW